MFDEINGLPLHPLAVHATVVLIPLAGLLGVLFAIPRTREWARVPLALTSLGAAVSTGVTRKSGEDLLEALQLSGPARELVTRHSDNANVLLWLVLGYAGLAVCAVLVSWRKPGSRTVVGVLSAVLVVGAAAMVFQAYRVGDLGTKAVWNPTGDVDYSSSA